MSEFFTQRHKGAKKETELQDLSALASLRDTSGFKSKRRGLLGHAISDALNAVLDQVVAEIDEEAKSFVHQPQIGQHLFAMDRIECGDRFHFHDHAIVDDQVGAKTFVERDSIPCDRNRDLSFHRVAAFAQFMRERDFVYDFEDAWTEPGVQAVGSVDDHSRDFILFHTAKPALLLRSCEAKTFAPWRLCVRPPVVNAFSRKAAKAQSREANQQILAPWRLCVRSQSIT
jgi:hypothetical protein